MESTIKERMNIFYKTTKISISLFSDKVLVHSISVPNNYLQKIENLSQSEKFEDRFYNHEIEKDVYCMQLKFANFTVLAGPYMYNISNQEINDNEFKKLPIIDIGSTVQFFKLLELLFCKNNLIFNDVSQSLSQLDLLEHNLIEYREIEFYHHDYYMETNTLSKMFKSKDFDELYIQSRPAYDLSGKVSENSLRQAKNIMIAGIAVFTRKAIELGVNPHLAFTISDMSIRKIEKTYNIADLDMVTQECFRSFYNIYNSDQHKKHSKRISAVLEFIDKNMTNKITLKSVADYLNVDVFHLSREIKKETGKTFTEQLINRRLDEAKRLLKYTDYNLTQVSEICGFLSKSYFIKVFKDHFKTTPIQYRKWNK